ncbi:MAG: ABC transporter permease [archaeon YNP-WB-062]|jgi:peptide/nickel transport system permease protein|nr:ABC transporter permease [Candidatus Verstraetearchaeota archaeon]MCS7367877.1 ABC transporter permease [Candidatus Culexarchaeum yellowstonense]
MFPKIVGYVVKRGVMLFLTVVIAIYITIWIANMGGYVDEIVKGDLYLSISQSVRQNPAYRHLNDTQVRELVDALYANELKKIGFDKPFIYRSFIYLRDAISLNLGRALWLSSNSGSKSVYIIISERLPNTVLLFTTTQLILFFIGLFAGLFLSRRYGSIPDKLSVTLAPLSSLPGWFYGIFLILIFASSLRILPYGGMVDVPPPTDSLSYALSVLKHMILPVLSWLIAYSFINIYSRRTFFLMFSSEDYVEMAKAKGLPESLIRRRYILRPTLPPIVTDFSLTLIASWMGAIITERVFDWPGIGSLLYSASTMFDTPVLVGLIVIYAYLLAATIFTLELVYAILDPRIRMGGV